MSEEPMEPRPLTAIESEMAALGAMLLNERVADRCLMMLDEADFYRPSHRLIFRAVRELRRREMEIDMTSLSQELESQGSLVNVGGKDYLTQLTLAVTSSRSYMAYVEPILETSRLRRLDAVAREALGKLLDPDEGSAADIAAWLASASLSVGGSAAGVLSMSDIDESGGDLGLSTGIREIDARMETGGAPLGQMCVIVAEEKHGKSTELVGMAMHDAWEGRGVLYVTLADLNPKRLKRKFLRGRCGYSEGATAKAAGKEAADAFSVAKHDLERVFSLEILDRTKLGGDDVDQVLSAVETYRQRRLKAKMPLASVYLDYFQKLTSKAFRPGDAVAMNAYCSKKISAYAEQTGIVFWVGSQLTQGNAKLGTRSMTKGGRALLEDCGMAWLIEKLDEEARKEHGCDARLTMTHSRFKGAGTVVDMRFDTKRDLLVAYS